MSNDQAPMTNKLIGHWCLVIGNLSLALFVPGVGADDVHASFATHNFAVLADFFDAGSNFHGARSAQSIESDSIYPFQRHLDKGGERPPKRWLGLILAESQRAARSTRTGTGKARQKPAKLSPSQFLARASSQARIGLQRCSRHELALVCCRRMRCW